ncbi:MAG: VOC family protein [Actinomycetota bacterium]
MTIVSPLPDGGWVDHIFWGVPDTEAAVELVAERTGVRANIGMQPEPSFPTLAAAISLGHGRFFEIHGPNPDYVGPDHFLHGLLSSLREPRLLLWYARSADLDRTAEQLAAANERFEPWAAAAEEWDNADHSTYRAGCIAGENLNPSIPYLIEWRNREDLDTKLVGGLSLARLWVLAKDPQRTAAVHELLGVDVPIESADRDGFGVELDTPNGLVRFD